MCRKTLIHYTSCGCQIMVETICFDYIQHTIKQKDRFPCVKMMSDTYVLKTINKNCFLKPGQLLDDGRIFRHGSYRTRLIYEFERDPNGTRRLWEKWRSDNRDKPRERTESMDVNISAGEDKMKIEADGADVDVDNSHKEREPKIREWQEKTKNEKQPRFKMEKQIKKRQPAGKRKIVNHFVDDLSDPRSDDEIIDDDWKLEPKVKIEPGDTVPWSTTPSRSFSDPTVADPNNTAQEMGINTPDNRGLFQGYRANALGATDTYHMPPTTPHSRFNFNPPATGTHTRYTKTNATNKPPKRNPSNSTYTDQTMNLGSPKAKPKTRAQTLAQSEMQISSPECANRSTYNAMSINHDMHSSFWAGHMSSSFEISNEDADADADIEIDNPPPYSAQALSILPAYQTATDTDTDAIGNTEANANTDTKSPNGPSSPGDPCISDISSASGFIGYNSTYGENQGVFGIYASGEGDQRERKKVRVRETEVENETGDVDSAEDDVKMGGE